MEKSGDNIFVLIILASIGALVISFAIFFFVIAYLRRVAKHRADIQQREMEHQAKLFASVVTSQEEERRLIGKELHDEVSSVLYAIRLRLKSNYNPENMANLEAIDKIIRITRNISHLLSPPEIEILGFHDAIKELCSNFSTNNSGIHIILNDTANGVIPQKKFQLSLMLYRVIQELITNTIKHAHATEIHIDISSTEDVFYVRYEDNGIGITEEKIGRNNMGFKNIISRLLLIKANYSLKTGKGFKFEIMIDHTNILHHE